MSMMILYNISKHCHCQWNGSCPEMAKNKKGIFGTVKDLSQSFNDRLTTLAAGFNKVILDLVFNTYKPDSLKQKTRETLTGKSSCTVQE